MKGRVIVKLKKEIIVQVDVPGIHQWLEAPQEVSWLKWPHRHLFRIRVGWTVSHNNREMEFFIQQKKVLDAVEKPWRRSRSGKVFDFMNSSCETIAETLAVLLDANWCEVSEDGENSARVVIERE